jgi:hypothetical protein
LLALRIVTAFSSYLPFLLLACGWVEPTDFLVVLFFERICLARTAEAVRAFHAGGVPGNVEPSDFRLRGIDQGFHVGLDAAKQANAGPEAAYCVGLVFCT